MDIDLSKLKPDELAAYIKIINDPIAWAEALLKNPEDGEPFRVNPVQRRILEAQTQKTVVRVHRRAGKCVAASEWITLADGSRVQAGDLIRREFELLTVTDEGIQPVKAYADYNDTEPVYRITTESGRTIVRNADHPLFTADKVSTRGKPRITPLGWTRLGDIQQGQIVAVSEDLPFDSRVSMPEEEIKILAYMIGDGGMTQSRAVFTQQEGPQLEEFRNCVEAIGSELVSIPGSRYGYVANGPRGVHAGPKGGTNPTINLLRKHGLFRKHSRDKCVPESVFQLPYPQLKIFLSRLFATDGWACVHTGHGSDEIGYCSTSEQLVRDVQELLLRFGICSRVYKRRTVNAWCLAISSSRDHILFADRIGIYGKEPAVDEVRNSALQKSKNYQQSWRHDQAPKCTRWERVVSVEFAGIEPTVAICVPGYETFLTTFYEHNSYLLAFYALWYATTHESAKVLMICPDKGKVKTLFSSIDEFLRVSPEIESDVIGWGDAPYIRRKFKNGSEIRGFTAGSSSKSGAKGIRSQTADVVIVDEAAFLNKEDWTAIEPIMDGDATRPNVLSFVSSTPTAKRERYWELCTRPDNGWSKVHVPVTENPDYPKERVDEIRANKDAFTFVQEWMAEFPEIGEGRVYKDSYVSRAQRSYDYYDPKRPDQIPRDVVRTMGVDWDKSQGVGPNIVILELDREHGVFKAVYHEEIPPDEYCLTAAMSRIIELNSIFNPQHIYVDRGLGEQQCELLHLYGKNHPDSYLDTKVRGISFSENIEILDPATRELVKKRIKPFMVNITVRWFEDNRIVYPKDHHKFTEQLQEFRILSATDSNIKYTSENEHIIDAFCLAAYAMHANYNDPFAFRPASDWYLLPVPEVVNSSTIDSAGRPIAFGTVRETSTLRQDFGRRQTNRFSAVVAAMRRGF